MTRRTFLTTTAALLAADAANEQAAILARIKPPTFPDRDFDITHYGAIAEAIAACTAAGGGRVIYTDDGDGCVKGENVEQHATQWR